MVLQSRQQEALLLPSSSSACATVPGIGHANSAGESSIATKETQLQTRILKSSDRQRQSAIVTESGFDGPKINEAEILTSDQVMHDWDSSSESSSVSASTSLTASKLKRLQIDNDAPSTPKPSTRCSPGAHKRRADDQLSNCRRSPGIPTGTSFRPNGGRRSSPTIHPPLRRNGRGAPWRSTSGSANMTNSQRQQTFIDSTHG